MYTYERDATGAWNATDLATTAQGQGFWLDASDDRIAVTVDASWRTSGGPGLAYVVESSGEGDWIETVLKSPDTDPMDGGRWSFDDWGFEVERYIVQLVMQLILANGAAYVYEWTSE